MPGANYMGGKRNAMKARVKDTVGRQQKGHFGRQRLDILSKGLAASKPSERSKSPRLAPDTISLAHARQRQRSQEGEDVGAVRRYIPSPVRISSSTPNSRRQLRGSDAHTSSSKDSRSHILDKLDVSEPLFLRRTLDRILAMPDLAGLSREASKTRKPSPKGAVRIIRDANKRGLDEPDTEQRPRKTMKTGDSSVVNTIWPSRNQQPHTPPRKRQIALDENGYHRRIQSPTEYALSSRDDTEDLLRIFDIDEDVHDSGYSEFFEGEGDDGHSSSWSIQQHISPTRHRHKPSRVEQTSSIPWSSPDIVPSSPSPTQRGRDARARGAQSDRALPSIIEFASVYQHSGNKGELSTVYGSLFEQPDPWRTIGVILGLAEEAALQKPEQPMNVEDEQDLEIVSGYSLPLRLQEEVPERIGLIDDENENLSSGDHAGLSDLEEEEIEESESSIVRRSPSSRSSPLMTLPTNRSPFRLSHSPFKTLPPFQRDTPSSSFSAMKKILEDQVDELLRQDEDYEEVLVVEHGSPPADEEGQISMKDDTSRRSPNVAVETPSLIQLEPGDGQSAELLEGQPDSTDILAMPELREVDGRYLGPSLFDIFQE